MTHQPERVVPRKRDPESIECSWCKRTIVRPSLACSYADESSLRAYMSTPERVDPICHPILKKRGY